MQLVFLQILSQYIYGIDWPVYNPDYPFPVCLDRSYSSPKKELIRSILKLLVKSVSKIPISIAMNENF